MKSEVTTSRRCVGLYGEGCFRPGTFAQGRCEACYRAWLRHGRPTATSRDDAFEQMHAAFDDYVNLREDATEAALLRARAKLDAKVAQYAPFANDKLRVARQRENLSVDDVVAIVVTMDRLERRRIAAACKRLPPEERKRRWQAAGRVSGMRASREHLRAMAFKGAAARWGQREPVTVLSSD